MNGPPSSMRHPVPIIYLYSDTQKTSQKPRDENMPERRQDTVERSVVLSITRLIYQQPAENAGSDGGSLMQRDGEIYHGGRRMTPSLATPLTFINGPLKDRQTHTHTQTHTHHRRFMTGWKNSEEATRCLPALLYIPGTARPSIKIL